MPSTTFLIKVLRNHYPGHPLNGLEAWLRAQLKVIGKLQRQNGEYPTRAAEDLYHNVHQVISWLRQWEKTPLGPPPKRRPGADPGAVLAELCTWCARTRRNCSDGQAASEWKPDPEPSTIEASLSQAAEWLRMDRRALKKRIDDEAIIAVQRSENKWVFDADQILRINPKANIKRRGATSMRS